MSVYVMLTLVPLYTLWSTLAVVGEERQYLRRFEILNQKWREIKTVWSVFFWWVFERSIRLTQFDVDCVVCVLSFLYMFLSI